MHMHMCVRVRSRALFVGHKGEELMDFHHSFYLQVLFRINI